MTDEDRRFVRVYYVAMIQEHPEVWNDNDLLATWIRLLAGADPMWPLAPEMPRAVKARALTRLLDSTLVTVTADHRYRIKGFDKERHNRRTAASNAAAKRWHSNGNASALLTPVPVPIQSKSTRETDDDGRADLEAFLVIKRKAPSDRQRKLLDDVMLRHDQTGPAWAADIMFRHPADPIGAVIEEDRAWRDERIAAAQAAEKPKPKVRRKAGMPESTRELLEHWKKNLPAEA